MSGDDGTSPTEEHNTMNDFFPVARNDKEIFAAAADYVAQQLGVRVTDPHPLAHDLSLDEIAIACGRRVRPFDKDPRTLRAAGMSTGDFSSYLAAGAQANITVRFQQQAQHLRWCWPFEVRDFTPAAVTAVDAEIDLLPVGEQSEIEHGHVRTAAGREGLQLVRHGRIVKFSRHLIIADEWDLIAMQLATVGPNAARLQATRVAAALEENPTLDDGGQVFHADYGTVHSSNVAPDATGLGVAMKALRTQKVGGRDANLELAHLAVAPDLEMQTLASLHNAGLGARISVTVMPELATGRWFAFCEPNLAPTIAVLYLKGDKQKVPVRVEQAKRPPNFDGAAVKVTAELGAAMVGRVGIFRGQAS